MEKEIVRIYKQEELEAMNEIFDKDKKQQSIYTIGNRICI